MSLEICVLGSGSSGNSTVVRAPWGAFLIDAGFGPRATDQRMHGIGLSVADLSAIVLTHLDSDHFNFYWLLTILKYQIRLHVARPRMKELLRAPEVRDLQSKLAGKHLPEDALEKLIVPFDDVLYPLTGRGGESASQVTVHALHLAHDEAGSHGFLLECDGYRVGFATDLGHVPEELIEKFSGVDLLALESNYDHAMELASSRPWYLKQRIMGGQGHLSNDQAFAAVQSILDRTADVCGPDQLPRHIVLLHRSRECNCPKVLRKLFSSDTRIAPVLTLTHQHERTSWLSARRPRAQRVEQLALAWS